ncbi:MAG: hypothetical protein EOR76_14455 [Mesorhizobium sp.]|nr:MAG: hypothetical protein EOR76_14455 [Mesorhizobium sp.]
MGPVLDEDADMPNASQKIAENVLLLAVSRISMVLALPMIGFITWVTGQWLESKFDAQDQRIVAQSTASENQSRITTARVETAEKTAQSAITQAGEINGRLISVETKQTQESAAADRFQSATLTRLDRVQDSIVGLSNAVAALTATLQAVAEERNRSPPAR